MSQAAGQLDLENATDTVDGHRDRLSKRELDYGDSSWPLYSMYSKIAEQDDNMLAERCQKDTTGTMVFTGLFAATVGGLLTVSMQDLKPNFQKASAFYLENIYHVLANPNATQVIASYPFTTPPVLSPPRYAIWVNSLWFSSLLISLAGASLTSLVQHWVNRYITLTQQPRHTPEQRARIRAFFVSRPWGPYVTWGSDRPPFYLHLSLFLFMAGSAIYLFNLSRAIFYVVVFWITIFTTVYVIVTVGGTLVPHELLYTPFSPLLLHVFLGISSAMFQVCSYIRPLDILLNGARKRYRRLSDRYSDGFIPGIWKVAEETTSNSSSEIDASVIERILLALDDDHTLEAFFNTIPGFCNSNIVDVPLPSPVGMKLRQALDGFLDRTFSSNSIPESVKSDRLLACLNAAHAALEPSAVSHILDDIFNGRWGEALRSVEIGLSLRRWGHGKNDSIDLNIRRIVACIVARARKQDDRWTRLAKDEFGVPDRVFRDYLVHGDTIPLAILIHSTRQALQTRRPQRDVLRSLSRINIHDTLPALQHEFCALWNEIVLKAGNDSEGVDQSLIHILLEIRHLFQALHQGTSAAHTTPFTISVDIVDRTLGQPSSYPLCNAVNRTDLPARSPAPVIVIPEPRLQTSTTKLGNPPGLSSLSPRSTSPEKQRISATSIDIAISTMQGDSRDTDIPILNPKANFIHHVLHQTKDKTPVPPTIVSDSPSIPVSIPRTSGVIPVDPHSSIEFTVIQPDPSHHHHRVSHTGRSQFHSSPTKKTHSRTSWQATSALDAHVTANIGALSAHDDASRNLNAPPNPLQLLHHPSQSTSPPAPGIITSTSRPEDRQHGLNKL
ncbi:hypothetical protein F5888DRAFT_670440 [Russula emetica]|nr:hypothetical protein F5888DRAFT_670440 [Russula emetica]